jgi:hypothetical protein
MAFLAFFAKSPFLSMTAEIYKKTYFDLLSTLDEPTRNKVLAAKGQENVTDKDVVKFIKRVIAKAECTEPEVKSECDRGQV